MPPNSRDMVYAALRDRLTTGHYDQDASLIPQVVSEEFNVSRTPVREALGLLERDGLLVPTNRGFVIRQRSDEEMLEIFEVRAVLESSAAFAAATRHSPIDLARLTEFQEQARRESDPALIRIVFNRWHDSVRHAAHNETISSMLSTLHAQIKLNLPWKTPVADESFERSLEEHAAIFDAIRERNAERARTLMLEHLAHDRDNRISQLVGLMAQGARDSEDSIGT